MCERRDTLCISHSKDTFVRKKKKRYVADYLPLKNLHVFSHQDGGRLNA